MGVDDRLGTIAVGKGADFIVLDANPLDDIGTRENRAGVSARQAGRSRRHEGQVGGGVPGRGSHSVTTVAFVTTIS